MNDGILFKEVKSESKELVYHWNFVGGIYHDNIRVYYKPIGEKNTEEYNTSGFHFYVAEFNSIWSEKENWDPEHQYINCLMEGTAYFDGLRHVYIGSETDHENGYCYYLNPYNMIKIMKILIDLEKEFCSMPNEDK